MAQVAALMQRAQSRAAQPPKAGFNKPDPSAFIPKGAEDAVQRVVAAGMKTMYAPAMRKQLLNEINRQVPVPQKLAEGVVGLVLSLDKQTQGGIPQTAIFPAILMLLGEAAELLINAGQRVTQDDYNTAAQQAFVLYARKMGAKDEDIMGELRRQQAGLGGGAPQMEPGEGAAHEQAEAPAMEQQETDATAQGLPEPDEQEAA